MLFFFFFLFKEVLLLIFIFALLVFVAVQAFLELCRVEATLVAVCKLLVVLASLVAEHRL